MTSEENPRPQLNVKLGEKFRIPEDFEPNIDGERDFEDIELGTVDLDVEGLGKGRWNFSLAATSSKTIEGDMPLGPTKVVYEMQPDKTRVLSEGPVSMSFAFDEIDPEIDLARISLSVGGVPTYQGLGQYSENGDRLAWDVSRWELGVEEERQLYFPYEPHFNNLKSGLEFVITATQIATPEA